MGRDFKIILPVAGEGRRLRPHTYAIPKPLIPVAGKPILSHILDPLIELEPEEVVLVVGHLSERIKDFVRSKYTLQTRFVEQTALLGLGFAIHLALEDMEGGPVLIVLGDTIAKTRFDRFIDGGGNIIGLHPVDDPTRFGVALIEKDRIIALEEKPKNPKSDLALIGLYFFEDSSILKEYLTRIVNLGKKTRGEIQLTDALEFMIRDGYRFKPFIVDSWYDCGNRETILQTNRVLLSEFSEVADYAGSVIIPPVYISPSAVVEESVIGPHVSVSDEARVYRSIVRDSIIGPGAEIEFSLLDSSLIGDKAVVKGTYSRLNVGDSSEVGDF
jgi:glucose-1-phosphate thymidylyltransferase